MRKRAERLVADHYCRDDLAAFFRPLAKSAEARVKRRLGLMIEALTAADLFDLFRLAMFHDVSMFVRDGQADAWDRLFGEAVGDVLDGKLAV